MTMLTARFDVYLFVPAEIDLLILTIKVTIKQPTSSFKHGLENKNY